MKPLSKIFSRFAQVGSAVIVPAIILWIDHFGWVSQDHPVNAKWGLLASAVVLLAALYQLVRADKRKLLLAVRVLFGISFSLVILLATNWITAVVLAAGYAAVLMALSSELAGAGRLVASGALQFVSLWAIFLAGAVWRWPIIVLLLLTYAATYTSASWLLDPYEERARPLLATAWALIACECAYVFSIWLVNYIWHNGWVILPQAALVITALGYVFASIYLAHKDSKLGRWRLAEYLLIGLLLIVIVAVGTKWSGSI